MNGAPAVSPAARPLSPNTDVVRRALLVGIEYRGTKNELLGSANDVRLMREMLESRGFAAGSIVTMTEDAPTPDLIPTRANILAGLAWLVRDTLPGDALVLHFSGHGDQAEAAKGFEFEEDGLDETILPLDFDDAGEITDNELHKMLVQDLPKGVRLTAFFDCSHSGSILDLPYSYLPDGRSKKPSTFSALRSIAKSTADQAKTGNFKDAVVGGFKRSLDRIKAGSKAEDSSRIYSNGRFDTDVILLAACKESQMSADMTLEGEGNRADVRVHNVPLLVLTQQIQMARTREYPKPTLGKLLQATRDNLFGFEQIPQLCSSRALDMNQPFELPLQQHQHPQEEDLRDPGDEVVPDIPPTSGTAAKNHKRLLSWASPSSSFGFSDAKAQLQRAVAKATQPAAPEILQAAGGASAGPLVVAAHGVTAGPLSAGITPTPSDAGSHVRSVSVPIGHTIPHPRGKASSSAASSSDPVASLRAKMAVTAGAQNQHGGPGGVLAHEKWHVLEDDKVVDLDAAAAAWPGTMEIGEDGQRRFLIDVETLPKAEIKRQEVMHEVITTENEYVRDLHILTEVFLRNMRQMKILPEDGLQTVFSNTEQLIDVNQVRPAISTSQIYVHADNHSRPSACSPSCTSANRATWESSKRWATYLLNWQALAIMLPQGSAGKQRLTRSLLFQAPDLKIYNVFCANHPSAIEYLQTQKANRDVNIFLQASRAT
nr:Ca(2+)-dependent cysteine protease [Polyrhizophydium stewartii]